MTQVIVFFDDRLLSPKPVHFVPSQMLSAIMTILGTFPDAKVTTVLPNMGTAAFDIAESSLPQLEELLSMERLGSYEIDAANRLTGNGPVAVDTPAADDKIQSTLDRADAKITPGQPDIDRP